MRLVFLVLLLANLAFFAWQLHFSRDDAQSDPRPMTQQIAPESLRILSSEAIRGASATRSVAAKAEPAGVCLEWGAFAQADAARAERALEPLALGPRLTRHQVEESAGWWVFVPSQGDRQGALKKAAELKSLGVQEYFIMQEEGPYRFALSLGVFKTREAAQSRLNALRSSGVKTAQLGERETQLRKVYLRASALEAPVAARLRELAQSFVGSEVRVCAADR